MYVPNLYLSDLIDVFETKRALKTAFMLLVQGVKHTVVVPKEMTVSLSYDIEGVGEEYRVSKRGRGWKFRGRKSRF